MKCHKNKCYKSKKDKPRQRGMAALMLVLWTAIGLSGLLFSLVSAHGSGLIARKTEGERNAARMAALICRNILLVELAENAGFVPTVNTSSDEVYKGVSCKVKDFFATGQYRIAHIIGTHISSGDTFTIEIKIRLGGVSGSEPGAIPTIEYTKEVEESGY